MFYSQDRNEIRQFFAQCWNKHQQQQLLEPMEHIIVEIISMHPEYHTLLEHKDSDLNKDYTVDNGESNPFMHMGMHIALREQLTVDRPPGFALVYKKLVLKSQDQHEVEHKMMECLGQALLTAQTTGQAPDDTQYLECLKKLS